MGGCLPAIPGVRGFGVWGEGGEEGVLGLNIDCILEGRGGRRREKGCWEVNSLGDSHF